MYLKIEYMILSGEHPSLVGIGPIAHSVYLKLIALCWKLGRSELTAGYLQASVLRNALNIPDHVTLHRALVRLFNASLISLGEVNGSPLRYQNVGVVGLEVKLPTRKWKNPRLDKTREDDTREEPKRALSPSVTLVQEAPKKTSQTAAGKRLEAVMNFWRNRFGSTLDFGQAGMIVKHCRRKGDSPWRFLSKIPSGHPAPWETACGFLQDTYAWPEMQDGQDTFQDWAETFERKAV